MIKTLTEEYLETISQLYDIDKNKINYSNKPKNRLSISNHAFKVFPTEFLFADFQFEIYFINCEFASFEYFCELKPCNNSFIFENCEFECFCLKNDWQFCNSFTINNKFIFLSCKFNDCIDIGKAVANNEITFSNCIFYKRASISGYFGKGIYFNDSIFCDYVDFHECEFEKAVCFYGVKFNKAPNFSACYFKEPKAVNLINVNTDKLDFKSIENYIKDNHKDASYENEIANKQQKEIIEIKHKYKLKYSKNLKDSFRVIKDILIAQNNSLEAQEWHKLELYAKEKELEIRLGENEENRQKYNPKDYEKIDIAKLKYIAKQIALCMRNCILLIGYVLFSPFFIILAIAYCFILMCETALKYISYFYQSLRPLDLSKFLIFWKVKTEHIVRKISVMSRKMIDFTTWFDCVLLQVYRNTSNHHTNLVKILNFTIGMISLYGIILFLFIKNIDFALLANQASIMFFICLVLGLFTIVSMGKNQVTLHTYILIFTACGIIALGIISFLSPKYIPSLCFILYFSSIIIFYTFFICKLKLMIFIVRCLIYVCFIIIVIIKPQLINPFIGIFSSDSLYESKLENKLNNLSANNIITLAYIAQKDFNQNSKNQNISFRELNAAKAFILSNKEMLYTILTSIYNENNINDYKTILKGLENNPSSLKDIIKKIDDDNKSGAISYQMKNFLNSNFNKNIDILYMLKGNFLPFSKKLTPEELSIFDKENNQTKLKNILSLLAFNQSFIEISKAIEQDKNIQDIIKSTSILYSIMLLLCIFSLQKTARKNSIVPS